jgi:hypothetical protein
VRLGLPCEPDQSAEGGHEPSRPIAKVWLETWAHNSGLSLWVASLAWGLGSSVWLELWADNRESWATQFGSSLELVISV